MPMVNAYITFRPPTLDELVDVVGGPERIVWIVPGVVEDLYDEHEDEEEDEGGVEVRHVEGGAQAPDQRVAAYHGGQQHRSQLGAQPGHQAAGGNIRASIKVREDFTITMKVHTRAFSWLKVPSSAFTFKTLFKHYAKQALKPTQRS